MHLEWRVHFMFKWNIPLTWKGSFKLKMWMNSHSYAVPQLRHCEARAKHTWTHTIKSHQGRVNGANRSRDRNRSLLHMKASLPHENKVSFIRGKPILRSQRLTVASTLRTDSVIAKSTADWEVLIWSDSDGRPAEPDLSINSSLILLSLH